ncbi:MAG: hypothetical protein GXY82_11275 [Methanospirillum sp.]|nr:hypothetical protein [Methanospirillum sp.]
MSRDRFLLGLALAGLVIAAALGSGCVADEPGDAGEDTGAQGESPGGSGGPGTGLPDGQETTLPIPIPLES